VSDREGRNGGPGGRLGAPAIDAALGTVFAAALAFQSTQLAQVWGVGSWPFSLAAGAVVCSLALLRRRNRAWSAIAGLTVAALAVPAAAAVTAGQWFGLVAAAALAGAAGIAWGVAKLAFDGLLQATIPTGRRGAAFTRSETLFSIAWVVGAILPTAVPLPIDLGLVVAGFGALTAQIVYVGALLVPPTPAADPPRVGPDDAAED
jgi:hypothetical protein